MQKATTYQAHLDDLRERDREAEEERGERDARAAREAEELARLRLDVHVRSLLTLARWGEAQNRRNATSNVTTSNDDAMLLRIRMASGRPSNV